MRSLNNKLDTVRDGKKYTKNGFQHYNKNENFSDFKKPITDPSQ